MRRLLSISLAVLLVASLSITLLPALTVAALEPSGAFHIQAEGEGEYLYKYPGSEEGTGEFSINIAGQKGLGYKWNPKSMKYYHGWGWGPQDTVQGYIRGSFGVHEIDVTLFGRPNFSGEVVLEGGKLSFLKIGFKGHYDGSKVTSCIQQQTQCQRGYIRLFYDENGELDYIRAELPFRSPGGTQETFLWIEMENVSVDWH